MGSIGTSTSGRPEEIPPDPRRGSLSRWIAVLGPGILVAATGVGAGDLATGAFTGAKLGLTVVWAVIFGAFLKFVINEGLMRWQLATGTTFLEGAAAHLGRPVRLIFLLYLLAWSYLVGGALMGACGVAAHAILPLEPLLGAADGMDSAMRDKIVYGMLHSAVAVALVLLGGYKLFERIMGVCILVMFVTVVVVACAVQPDPGELVSGLVPRVSSGEGFRWSVALIGGVGGTLTVLCYGYWIREEGRTGADQVKLCRADLAVGYTVTAVFGICMVILGSRIPDLEGGGSKLVVALAGELQNTLGDFGTVAKWFFLAGAWGAIASSLLGVWQSVPYLFADYRRVCRGLGAPEVSTKSRDYRFYLFALASVPSVSLFFSFKQQQLIYSVVGALCVPLLGAALLSMNSRRALIGERHRNSLLTNLVLVLVLLFFVVYGWLEIRKKLGG